MIEELDDLTLVYMYGAKNGRDSMKDENERLRAALQAIAQCRIPARLLGRLKLWNLTVQMQETAIAALKEGEKKDV